MVKRPATTETLGQLIDNSMSASRTAARTSDEPVPVAALQPAFMADQRNGFFRLAILSILPIIDNLTPQPAVRLRLASHAVAPTGHCRSKQRHVGQRNAIAAIKPA